MTFYWNPEPSIKVTFSINAFRTAETKPHICAQLAGGALTMIGNQSGAHSLNQIDKKKEKKKKRRLGRSPMGFLVWRCGRPWFSHSEYANEDHPPSVHTWLIVTVGSHLCHVSLSWGRILNGDSVLGLRQSSAWIEQVKSTSSGPHDTHKTSPPIAQEIWPLYCTRRLQKLKIKTNPTKELLFKEGINWC